jgi:hypothetical protein
VLLLRDVFEFEYAEIAALIGKSEPACRKLLERARANVATEKRRTRRGCSMWGHGGEGSGRADGRTGGQADGRTGGR